MDQFNYSEHNKTSVKVHHVPGGASQWSIGGGYDEPKYQKPQAQQQQYHQAPQQNSYQQPSYQQNSYQQPQTDQFQSQYQQQSIGGYYGGNQKQEQFQPQYDAQPRAQQRNEHNFGEGDRSSTRIHAPPGGKSSINIFGGGNEPVAKQSRGGMGVSNSQSQLGSSYQVGQSYSVNTQSHVNQGYSNPAAFANRDMNQGYGQQQQQQQFGGYPPPKPGSYNVPQNAGGSYVPTMYNAPQQQQYQQQQQEQWQKPQYQQPQQHSTMFGGGQQPQPKMATFGQRVESGNNSGPTSGKSSIKLHNPPGGRSNFQLM